MKIALSSISRAHLFALARGLSQSGHLAKLYSAHPYFMIRPHNIPRELVCNFPWVHIPTMALFRYGAMPQRLDNALNRFDHASYAAFVARNLVDMDIFHGLSGHNLKAGLLAKKRGASYVCDRGSSHIAYQDKIMQEEGVRMGVQVEPIDPFGVETELAEYAAADRIFVPSLFARRTFIEAGIPAQKMWCLPYGVNLERWHTVKVASDGVFRVVFLGSLSLRKGIHDLLAAFKQVSLPKSELVLIGSRSPETERLIRHDKLPSNVVLTGRLPHNQVLEWFSRSSVFVLPSIEDGFGLVIMEAMACGLPVIATANTGGPGVIEDGINGFVVPIRSPEAIAEKLLFLFQHRDQLQAMQEAVKASIRLTKGWDTFTQGMLGLYLQLINSVK
jgi:glycosyltransferase involved in cell wall biosynthesis